MGRLWWGLITVIAFIIFFVICVSQSFPAEYHYCGPSEAWIRAHHKQYRHQKFWVIDHCGEHRRERGR